MRSSGLTLVCKYKLELVQNSFFTLQIVFIGTCHHHLFATKRCYAAHKLFRQNPIKPIFACKNEI